MHRKIFSKPYNEKEFYIINLVVTALGIIDSKYAPKEAVKGAGGAIVYWHVDDLQETLDLLISKGAKSYEPICDRSGGKMAFVTASVVDPFGNILGIMYNSHYIEILDSSKSDSIQD